MEKRKFLVWISANNGFTSIQWDNRRKFDVAIHDYGQWRPERDPSVEYWIPSERTEKLETAAANIRSLPPYDYYAFLDDDLIIGTEALNDQFGFCGALRLELCQPALSKASVGSWSHLFQRESGCPARPVPFVEVMCPFFSRAALEKCLWSFDLNQSGWGLDCHIWPKLVKCWVNDCVTVHHPGPFRRPEFRKMRNGLTAWQELDIVKKIDYDGSTPW